MKSLPLAPVPAAVAVAALVLAGCGGSSADTSTPDRSASEPVETPSAPGTVAMKGLEFLPDRLTVAVGETVTWTNEESLDHNVVARKGARFRSRAFGRGGTYTFTPERPGTIDYVCTLHPGMEGRIVVTRS